MWLHRTCLVHFTVFSNLKLTYYVEIVHIFLKKRKFFTIYFVKGLPTGVSPSPVALGWRLHWRTGCCWKPADVEGSGLLQTTNQHNTRFESISVSHCFFRLNSMPKLFLKTHIFFLGIIIRSFVLWFLSSPGTNLEICNPPKELFLTYTALDLLFLIVYLFTFWGVILFYVSMFCSEIKFSWKQHTSWNIQNTKFLIFKTNILIK